MFDKITKYLQHFDDRDTKVSWRSQNPNRTAKNQYIDALKIIWSIRLIRWVMVLFSIEVVTVVLMFVSLYIDESSANFPQPVHPDIFAFLRGLFYLIQVLWLLMILLFITLAGRTRKAICNYYLSQSLCPACQCDMRGQPVEEDGCVVCPNRKCGAAWKLTSRVMQP